MAWNYAEYLFFNSLSCFHTNKHDQMKTLYDFEIRKVAKSQRKMLSQPYQLQYDELLAKQRLEFYNLLYTQEQIIQKLLTQCVPPPNSQGDKGKRSTDATEGNDEPKLMPPPPSRKKLKPLHQRKKRQESGENLGIPKKTLLRVSFPSLLYKII